MSYVAAQPPLTRRGRAWRLLAAIFGGLVLSVAQFSEDTPSDGWRPVLDLVVGTACIVGMRWRRRWPATVATLTALASLVTAFGAVAAVISFVSLVTTRRWRPIVAVSLLTMATTYAAEQVSPTGADTWPWWVTLLVAGTLSLLAVMLGLYIGAQRELARAMQERRADAERQQVARVEQARLSERTRIAREMHDVLAHRISLVSLHAGAMTFRPDLGVEELRASAVIVQENAHQALLDLRDVLGVLREDVPSPSAQRPGGPSPGGPSLGGPSAVEQEETTGWSARSRPQPTLSDLPELVLQARAAGTPVDVHDELPRLAALPETVGRTAYRIIQESLTNARKHAPGSAVTVHLTGQPESRLGIEVSNPVPDASLVSTPGASSYGSAAAVPGAGMGLIGLTERATLAGGALVHGPTPENSYRVQAWLPWS